MASRGSTAQMELFGGAATPREPPEESLVRWTRAKLTGDLAAARAAGVFPWKDLTVALNAEMEFNSLAGAYLPEPEAHELCAAYADEIARLYDLIDEGWVPLYRQLGLRRN